MFTFLKYIFSGDFHKLRRYSIWRSYIFDYKNHFLSRPLHVIAVHNKGFSVNDWDVMNLTDENYKSYLTSEQYHRIHPLNGKYSRIIDDKMTIKYVFYGTKVNNYMPKYYFCSDEEGMFYPLMEAPDVSKRVANQDDIMALLTEKKRLAFKPLGGSLGRGFCKVELINEKIYINNIATGKENFYKFIHTLKNYLVLEYLVPHPYLARYCPDTPNTIRYLVGRVNDEWRMLKSFIRFGTTKTGCVENFNSGGILCYINPAGHFHGGYIIQKENKRKRSVSVDEHPDAKLDLDGDIPLWGELMTAVKEIESLLPQTKYLGFDFVVTNKNEVKLLEINSLTSLDSLQLDGPIWENENGKWFFRSLL